MKKKLALNALISSVFTLSLGLPAFAHDDGTDHLDGELDVIQIDYPGGTSKVEYFLRDSRSKRRVPVLISNEIDRNKLVSGHQVTIRGKAKGKHVGGNVSALIGESGVEATSIEVTSTAATTTVQTETRRAVALIVNMQNATSVDLSPTTVSNRLYYNTNSIRDFWESTSHQQLTFEPDSNGDGNADVFGPLSIAYDGSTNCDYYSWADAADTAAKNAGVDLSLYQHRIYILPSYSKLSCGWAGLANVGCGTYCRSWISDASNRVYTHELGHNLSFHHASTDLNNDGVVESEYGDNSDVMGLYNAALNAPNRYRKGWLNAFSGAAVQGTQAGTYTLAPLDDHPDLNPGTAQVLMVPKSNTNQTYFVSYRTVGEYSASTDYRYKLQVHKAGSSVSTQSMLVANLAQGQTFTDATNGISITASSVGGTTAAATLDLSCMARKAPTLQLTPSSVSLSAGASTSMTATITNGDSSSCGSTPFNLSQTLPVGVTGSTSVSSIDVPAGQSRTVTWSLTTSNTLIAGTYNASLAVSDGGVHAQTSNQASLKIDSTAATAPQNLKAALLKGKVALSWTAATDTESGVSRYQILRNGSVLAEITGTSYNDSQTTSGSTYTYTVTAINGAGIKSAQSNSVSITISKGRK